MSNNRREDGAYILQKGDNLNELNDSVIVIPKEFFSPTKISKVIKKKRVKSKHQINDKPTKLLKIKDIKEDEETELKLAENAKEWAKKMELGGKKIIYSMLSKLKCHKIPIKDGSQGISLKDDNIYLSDIFPFLIHFMPETRKSYWWNTSNYQYPHTGKRYLHLVWKIDSLEDLIENLFCTFENLKISTNVLWLQHPFQPRMMKRFDDPENNEQISFIYDEDRNKVTEELRNFNMKTFNNETSVSKQVKMVVGSIPANRKRVCYFNVSFTRNWESDQGRYLGGSFQFRFFHEVYESGMLKGLYATGDSEDQNLEEITNGEAHELLNEDQN
eukprot:TRINITY_DN4127_c0_g1_i1.p1 TRINITY_DN4127_c0_g1~~TRINITY_DN4127_c0_g1_i1.p1  ORF type:complete len:330 (+),score=89.55 TRINITY_DN4127_c0_g1_i1:191-1180(+)